MYVNDGHVQHRRFLPAERLSTNGKSVYLKKKDQKGIMLSERYIQGNACIESFHSLIKREWLNRFKIRDYKHAYQLVFEYLEAFYNTKRIHSHCDYMSPNDYEELYHKLQQDELMLVS